MQIRFFCSSKCADCFEIIVFLYHYSVENYEIIDALSEDEDIQRLCDEQNVDRLPHLQIVHDDKVLEEHVGSLDEKTFLKFVGFLVD